MKPVNLKARILVPLVLVLASVPGAFILGMIVESNEHVGEDFARSSGSYITLLSIVTSVMLASVL